MEGKLIFELIPKVMQDVGVVGKGRRNQAQNYAFRGIDDMYNALQPVLIKHGVFVCPSVLEQVREDRVTKGGTALIYTVLTVKHTLYAPDGSNVEVVTVGEAMDSGDKSANKAMSAAMKYALIEVFSIPTEGDNDTENHTPEVAARTATAKLASVAKPSGDPLMHDERFKAEVDKTFAARGFDPDAADAAVASVLKKKSLVSLAEIPGDNRGAFIKFINSGKLDSFRKAAVNV